MVVSGWGNFNCTASLVVPKGKYFSWKAGVKYVCESMEYVCVSKVYFTLEMKSVE